VQPRSHAGPSAPRELLGRCCNRWRAGADASFRLSSHGAIYAPENLSAKTPLPLDKINASDNWTTFGRNANGTRFAPFTDINPENVNDLQVAWTYHTGRRTTGPGAGVDENTPLQIGNAHSCTPENLVTALDADTGKALWKFDPHAHAAEHVTCRGVGYYDLDTDTSLTPAQKAALPAGTSHQRLLISTVDARLIALTPTGKPVADFGKGGSVTLPPAWAWSSAASAITRLRFRSSWATMRLSVAGSATSCMANLRARCAPTAP
jgi:glucose dehydrogenase